MTKIWYYFLDSLIRKKITWCYGAKTNITENQICQIKYVRDKICFLSQVCKKYNSFNDQNSIINKKKNKYKQAENYGNFVIPALPAIGIWSFILNLNSKICILDTWTRKINEKKVKITECNWKLLLQQTVSAHRKSRNSKESADSIQKRWMIRNILIMICNK